jgi:heparan-sulfate lyase
MLATKNKYPGWPKWYMAKIRRMVQAIEVMSFPNGRAPHFGDQGAMLNTDNAIKGWYRHFNLQRRQKMSSAENAVALRHSGMFNIRSNWTANASMLLMRCGPSYNAHSHKDSGTFSLFADGRILLPDSGCFTYTGIKEVVPVDSDRQYFQGTAAHNTLTLNGADVRFFFS